ncbi:MAG: tRNA dihydrouridine synthase DusB [Acidobacteriota bacterium]
MLQVGGLAIDPPLVLAPMAGITDRDFRLVIRRLGGCGLVSMEFVSSEGLTRGHESAFRILHFVDEEQPLAVQIFGSSPERMAEAARIVEGIGARVCDINMGCPANKVLKGCAGAALGADLARAEAILRAVRAAISIPLTVKFRLGLREDSMTYLELGRLCQDEGADAVTLHPRTARQQFAGHADWRHIAILREALAIPVIGNGDVTTPADASRMLAETGCAGVMIGRAALANPWIFRQTAALLRGCDCSEPTIAERRALMCGHFRDVLEREDPRMALHKLRRFTGWYTLGLPEGRLLRRRLSELDSAVAVMDAVDEFFSARSAA